jgi:hypothetical protein
MAPSLTILKETVSARRELLEVNFTRNGSKLIGVAAKLLPIFYFYSSNKFKDDKIIF